MVGRVATREALPVKIEQLMQKIRRFVVELLPLGDHGASWSKLRTEAP